MAEQARGCRVSDGVRALISTGLLTAGAVRSIPAIRRASLDCCDNSRLCGVVPDRQYAAAKLDAILSR
jgi:hypothetical protein